jgi:hypothetical protein
MEVHPMPAKSTPHLRLRIEPRLLARLEKAKERSGRTLTGEIIERLEQSFRLRELFLAQEAAMNKLSSELAMELTKRVALLAAANKKEGAL